MKTIMEVLVGPFGPLAFTCPVCGPTAVHIVDVWAGKDGQHWTLLQLECSHGHRFEVEFRDSGSGVDGWLRDGHPTVLPERFRAAEELAE